MEIDHEKKLHDLLSSFHTAMFVSHAGPNELRARPMALLEVEASCRMWFIADRVSAKVHEIERDTRVLIVCQNGESCHLSVNGLAHLEQDRGRIDRLWNESFKIWFPEGRNDPSITLIGVHPIDAEYWDNRGMKGVKYLVKSAQAYFSGDTPKIDADQHARVVLMP